MLPGQFDLYKKWTEIGYNRFPLDEREPQFSNAHYEAIEAILNLNSFLEQYLIIHKNIDIFCIALQYSIHSMQESFREFHTLLLKHIPDHAYYDERIPRSGKAQPQIPSNDELEQIAKVSSKYTDSIMDAICFVADLAVESQNILLGGLFEHRLNHRNPEDKTLIILKTNDEDYVRLKKYFYEETEWGKHWKELKKVKRI